ncbi:prolyl oligopeptidase family serine peptidase [Deinococcus xianganensis]|uniref:Prolyl oligopeptidase family serine peptidase n=1 Tax=Deinococcus xianganensis TaxID=1507289 RepID=A0A6I4YPG1_9DEIO|nr:prolyl oligopeptidase family serine peptidase [Deinococcus xianganensis]MXV21744.1 prolyl oligopeptidase family serine peptidase [Deinococcus xianganensis]
MHKASQGRSKAVYVNNMMEFKADRIKLVEEIARDANESFGLESIDYVMHCGDCIYYWKSSERHPVLFRRTATAEEEIFNLDVLEQNCEFIEIIEFKISPDLKYIAVIYDISGKELNDFAIIDIDSKNVIYRIRSMRIGSLVSWSNSSSEVCVSQYNGLNINQNIIKINLRDECGNSLLHHGEAEVISIGGVGSDQFLICESDGENCNYYIKDEKSEFKIDEPCEGYDVAVEYQNGEAFLIENRYSKLVIYHLCLEEREFKIFTSLNCESEPVEILISSEYICLIESSGTSRIIYKYCKYDNYYQRSAIYTSSDSVLSFVKPIGSLINSETIMISELLYTSYSRIITLGDNNSLNSIRENGLRLSIKSSSKSINLNGTSVPVTEIYAANHKMKHRVILTLYASYGIPNLPFYDPILLYMILFENVKFVIVHSRGTGGLGEVWTESGKGAVGKLNSVEDFLSVAEYYYQLNGMQLSAMANSAGATLLLSAVHRRHEFFSRIVLKAPFVSVVETLLNANLPYSIEDRAEWGDPTILDDLILMNRLDPMRNIRRIKDAKLPDLMVFSSENDIRSSEGKIVDYLRHYAKVSPSSDILLESSKNSGHSGESVRSNAICNKIASYMFLLNI